MRGLGVLLFLLVFPALGASTPTAVVNEVYTAHRARPEMGRTVKEHAACFTPGFLGVIERALAKKPGSGDFVDADFFFNTQDGGSDFELGAEEVHGKDATVLVQVFQRGDYRNPKPDPNWRAKVKKIPLRVVLTDVGQGFQIKDLEWLPYDYKWPDGSVHRMEGYSVRQMLEKIANSR